MPLLCYASLREAARANLGREAPLGSRGSRSPQWQPKPAGALCQKLRAGLCSATRESASRGACTPSRTHSCAASGRGACAEQPPARGAVRAASSPEDEDEAEQQLKQQHVANLGKIRTEAQRQRVRTRRNWRGCARG